MCVFKVHVSLCMHFKCVAILMSAAVLAYYGFDLILLHA